MWSELECPLCGCKPVQLKRRSDAELYHLTPDGPMIMTQMASSGLIEAVKLMQAEKWDTDLLEDLCQVMGDASICGLGQAAPNPIRLVMKHFANEI